MATPKWRTLRKFTLEYCDLPTMLWNVAVLLRVLSLNIQTSYKKGIPVYYYVLTLVCTVCYFYVFLLDMVWLVFVRCAETGDMIAAMVILSLGLSTEIGPMKLLYMFVYRDKIRQLTDDYLACDAQTTPGSRFHVNMLKVLRKVKLRAMVFWVFVVVNGNLYLLVPIFYPGKNLPENYYVIYGLEPMLETPNYQIIWILMTISVHYICYVPACTTAYLLVIAGYTEAQMLALSEEIINIWPDAIKHVQETMEVRTINKNETKTKILLNSFVHNRLKDIIVHHAMLQNLFDDVANTFAGSIAIGFFLLIGGVVPELLGKLENTYMQLPFTLMQVSMDCLAGQNVMDASLVFERAVYDCQWENFDKTNMKLVLVMLQSSQRVMTLSAGGLATLSFSCLMNIARRVYSAYTALRSAF